MGKEYVVLRFKEGGTTVTLPGDGGEGTSQGLRVDATAREVLVHDIRLGPPLTRKEFDLLLALWQRQGKACSKDDIVASVWPEREGGEVADYEIDQCVRRLRRRIEANPSKPQFIVTLRGFGYKLA